DGNFEVILKLNIESKSKEMDEVLFILEIEYAGVFSIENVPDDQMHPFLMIECPRMIFPYLRRIVGDITRDGGYPPLNLENIDFLALYRNEIQRRAQAEKAGQPIA
ncbi:MAG: preprotein translocase subunit SecB, partial [Paracoccaceae bacterium]